MPEDKNTVGNGSSQAPEPLVGQDREGGFRGWVRKRPVLAVALFAFLGLFLGAAVAGEDTEKDERIAALERQLAQTEPSPAAQPVAEEEVTAFTDGIWKTGVDFERGTYRAKGGPGCYWALLRSADTSDIINNGGFGPNQTVDIDSPWFEASDCGEWQKIG